MKDSIFMKPEVVSSPILVDPQQASRMLAICPRKLWQMTKDRQIPSLKIGKSVRYRVADLNAWTEQQARMFGATAEPVVQG